jgi:ATP-dependent HslUV protease ATP-binding subunit HslU
MTREEEMAKVRHRAADAPRIGCSTRCCRAPGRLHRRCGAARRRHPAAISKMLREGELDDREIEIEVRALPVGVEIMAPPAWRK